MNNCETIDYTNNYLNINYSHLDDLNDITQTRLEWPCLNKEKQLSS